MPIEYSGAPDAVTLAGLGGQPLPTRILTVSAAGQGGEFATIPLAIAAATALTPSATNRVLIFLFPGIHTVTALQTLPRWVDISGAGYAQITGNANATPPGWYDGSSAPTSALLVANGDNRIGGIIFKNNRTIYPAVCLYANCGTGKTITVQNCEFYGDGQDLLYTNGLGTVFVEDCYVSCQVDDEVTDAISVIVPGASATHYFRRVTVEAVGHNTIWASGPGTVVFEGCSFWSQEALLQGNLRFGDVNGSGTTVRCSHCSFLAGATPAPGPVISTVGPVGAGTAGVNVILQNCTYSTWNYAGDLLTLATEGMGNGAKTTGGAFGVTGAFTANAGGTLGGEWAGSPNFTGNPGIINPNLVGVGEPSINFTTEAAPGDEFTGVINFGGGGAAADTVLKREGSGLTIAAAARWRYFDAVSCADGERTSYNLETTVGPGMGWAPNADTAAAYLLASVADLEIYFPVRYEPGSVITRVSARWQGVGANDGIVLTLQKRQGGTTTAAWATVGVAQTLTGTSETNTVYDPADETMTAGYEYRVAVKSAVVTTGARLWEIGVETSKRAY